MIHQIGVELEAELVLQGCPFDVIDGPERTKVASWGRERIVIEHDDQAGDRFAPVRGQRTNPKHRATRKVGCKITIYAQAAVTGALEFEHRRRAEHVLDMVYVALDKIAIARRNELSVTGGHFVQPEEFAKTETPAGVVYELTFTIDRAVMAKTWAGAARPEATITRFLMTGSPTLTFDGTAHTITRSAGSWITDGFKVGMPITVGGSVSNNGSRAIASLTATVLTFVSGLVNEGPSSGCSVIAGGMKSTTKVSLAQGPDDDGNPATVPAGAETSCG